MSPDCNVYTRVQQLVLVKGTNVEAGWSNHFATSVIIHMNYFMFIKMNIYSDNVTSLELSSI